jgi:hypothetical protein
MKLTPELMTLQQLHEAYRNSEEEAKTIIAKELTARFAAAVRFAKLQERN